MRTENSNLNQGDPIDKNMFSNSGGPFYQMELPDSTTVLVLGILSIPGCMCYGFAGLILSIIALVMYKKPNALYLQNPNQYTSSSYNNLKAGRICAIIGLIFSCIVFVIIIIEVIFIGAMAFNSNEFIN